jgi:hypothetical protein
MCCYRTRELRSYSCLVVIRSRFLYADIFTSSSLIFPRPISARRDSLQISNVSLPQEIAFNFTVAMLKAFTFVNVSPGRSRNRVVLYHVCLNVENIVIGTVW